MQTKSNNKQCNSPTARKSMHAYVVHENVKSDWREPPYDRLPNTDNRFRTLDTMLKSPAASDSTDSRLGARPCLGGEGVSRDDWDATDPRAVEVDDSCLRERASASAPALASSPALERLALWRNADALTREGLCDGVADMSGALFAVAIVCA